MKNFKSGTYINQGDFKSFHPTLINRQWTVEDMDLITILSQADRQIGRLDMYSEYIPNIDLFISMHVLKEATKSSRIEGTKTDIEEALLDKGDVPEGRRDDWVEVWNYIEAMTSAIKDLEQLPISSRLIRKTHKTLLKGARGELKQPGEYRRSQNWIGGSDIASAIFVPPPHNMVGELMSDLENFVHNEDLKFPELLRIALIHYQFETIHPFLDGNGRVGRLLITLYLVDKKILKKPILYLSDYFERNKSMYYDNLMKAREKNDLITWFKFFLTGVIETAKAGISTFDSILKLQEHIKTSLQALGPRASQCMEIVEYLYQHPIIDASQVSEITKKSMPTAYKIINDLERLEIVREITGGQRGKQYAFQPYVNLFR